MTTVTTTTTASAKEAPNKSFEKLKQTDPIRAKSTVEQIFT